MKLQRPEGCVSTECLSSYTFHLVRRETHNVRQRAVLNGYGWPYMPLLITTLLGKAGSDCTNTQVLLVSARTSGVHSVFTMLHCTRIEHTLDRVYREL